VVGFVIILRKEIRSLVDRHRNFVETGRTTARLGVCFGFLDLRPQTNLPSVRPSDPPSELTPVDETGARKRWQVRDYHVGQNRHFALPNPLIKIRDHASKLAISHRMENKAGEHQGEGRKAPEGSGEEEVLRFRPHLAFASCALFSTQTARILGTGFLTVRLSVKLATVRVLTSNALSQGSDSCCNCALLPPPY
jgi:hypothetical protein